MSKHSHRLWKKRTLNTLVKIEKLNDHSTELIKIYIDIYNMYFCKSRTHSTVAIVLINFTTQNPNEILKVFELKLNFECRTNQCQLDSNIEFTNACIQCESQCECDCVCECLFMFNIRCLTWF